MNDTELQSLITKLEKIHPDEPVRIKTVLPLLRELRDVRTRAQRLRDAAEKVIEMNRQHAHDQYGDREKAEQWACVTTLRAALTQ